MTVAVCVIGGSLAAAVARQVELIDRILAIVDGQVILHSDVTAFIALQLVDIPAGPEQTSHVLTYLIERRLILDQADRLVAEPAPELVDQRLEAVRQRFGSDADLTAMLDRLGLSVPDLRQLLADDVRARAYRDNRFAALGDDRREQAHDEWLADLVRRAQVRRVSP